MDRCTGFSVPSAVQHHGIAASVSGRHVVFAARHGSGRTTAACISVLNNLKADTDGCQALILTPSREEGELVQSLVEALGAGLAEGRKTVTCHACGSRKEEDARILQGSGVQVVAGKPDHVKDMLDQHFMQPRSIKVGPNAPAAVYWSPNKLHISTDNSTLLRNSLFVSP